MIYEEKKIYKDPNFLASLKYYFSCTLFYFMKFKFQRSCFTDMFQCLM